VSLRATTGSGWSCGRAMPDPTRRACALGRCRRGRGVEWLRARRDPDRDRHTVRRGRGR
jgi:hypothetical protein